MKRKPENTPKKPVVETFNRDTDKIKNSDVSGKKGIYVPEEKMTIYIREGKDPQQVLDKFKQRRR